MMIKKNEKLKERYPSIAKKHKRTDLEPIYEVETYISQESNKKREVTAREIWLEIKKYPKRVIDKSVKWLYESGLIKRKRMGSGFFFCEEKENGTFGNRYYTREDIDNVKEARANEVLGFTKKKSILLQKEIQEHYQKLNNSLKRGNPNLNSYNKIVEFLWEKGFSESVKLSFKSGAYRYSK